MTEEWSIDEIITTRRLAPGDDLSTLSAHIKKNGLKIPILVSRQKVIIDGLRRLEALKLLGETKIPVTVAVDFDTACAEIAKARKHGVDDRTSWQRTWELYSDTRLLMVARMTMSRQRSAKDKVASVHAGKGVGASRPMLSTALGLSSISALQSLTRVYMLAENDDTVLGDRAREILPRLQANEITPYQAYGYAYRDNPFTGDVTGVEEQRTLLGSVTNTLSGVAKGLDKLGELNPGLQARELNAWLTSLKKSRARIIRFVRQLEESSKK